MTAMPSGYSAGNSNVVPLLDWCLNEYENPKNTLLSGDNARVARGGSWDYVRDSARASYRFNYDIDRDNYLGFRLMCVRPLIL